jgi:hypothetical protein
MSNNRQPACSPKYSFGGDRLIITVYEHSLDPRASNSRPRYVLPLSTAAFAFSLSCKPFPLPCMAAVLFYMRHPAVGPNAQFLLYKQLRFPQLSTSCFDRITGYLPV